MREGCIPEEQEATQPDIMCGRKRVKTATP